MHALSAVPKMSFFDRLVGAYVPRQRSQYMHAMKIEPKSFFANERTFLAWLHMAVTIGSVAAALLGFAATADRCLPLVALGALACLQQLCHWNRVSRQYCVQHGNCHAVCCNM